MLKVLRDNLKFLSWILWLVILVFVAFVFVDFGGVLSGSRVGTSAAATVGGEQVSLREFQRQYKRLDEQYRQAFGERYTPELAEQMQLPAQALEQLVDRKLLAGEARRRGLTATDEEVQRAVLAIPGLRTEAGAFVGVETYRRFLRANGYSEREFEEFVRESLAVEKLTGTLSAAVAVTDDEVERAWREQNERARVRYVLAPSTQYLPRAGATAAEVEAYFAAHRDEFRLPDQRVVDYLLVDTAKLRAAAEVPAAEIERYYRDHRDEFTSEEQVQARHILAKIDEERSAEQAAARIAQAEARLARGEAFEQVAAALSEDPGSKDRGGDLGWFGRGRMIQEFEQAAFAAEPGQVVGPVRTSFGLHLIEVLGRRPGGERPLAEVEAGIRTRLAGERATAAAERRARELAARLAEEQPDEAGWKALADGEAVTFVTTPPFGRDEPVPGIGRNPDFAAAAFALETGGVSAPVELPRGWAVLRLREQRPARTPELAEVEARVRAAAEREKAAALARAELERLRAELAAGQSLDQAAASHGLTVADSGEFTLGGTIPGLGAARPVGEAALALGPGQIGGPLPVAAGAVLFEVVERTPFDRAAFESARAGQREELRRAEAQRLIGSLVSALRAEAGVTYDPQLLEQFGIRG